MRGIRTVLGATPSRVAAAEAKREKTVDHEAGARAAGERRAVRGAAHGIGAAYIVWHV